MDNNLYDLFVGLGLDKKGSFEDFKKDVSNETNLRALFDYYDFGKNGSFEDFKKDLGFGTTSISKPKKVAASTPKYTKPELNPFVKDFSQVQTVAPAKGTKSTSKAEVENTGYGNLAEVAPNFEYNTRDLRKNIERLEAKKIKVTDDVNKITPTSQVSSKKSIEYNKKIDEQINSFKKLLPDAILKDAVKDPEDYVNETPGIGEKIIGSGGDSRAAFETVVEPAINEQNEYINSSISNSYKKLIESVGPKAYADFTEEEGKLIDKSKKNELSEDEYNKFKVKHKAILENPFYERLGLLQKKLKVNKDFLEDKLSRFSVLDPEGYKKYQDNKFYEKNKDNLGYTPISNFTAGVLTRFVDNAATTFGSSTNNVPLLKVARSARDIGKMFPKSSRAEAGVRDVVEFEKDGVKFKAVYRNNPLTEEKELVGVSNENDYSLQDESLFNYAAKNTKAEDAKTDISWYSIATQGLDVLGDIGVDILTTKGYGKVLGGSKLAFNVGQSMSAFSRGYGATYNELIKNPAIPEDGAKFGATIAGAAASLLTKINPVESRLAEDGIESFLSTYVKENAEKLIKGGVRVKDLVMEGLSSFGRGTVSGLKEAGEEISEAYVNNYIVNKNLNEAYGSYLEDSLDKNEIIQTALVSMLPGYLTGSNYNITKGSIKDKALDVVAHDTKRFIDFSKGFLESNKEFENLDNIVKAAEEVEAIAPADRRGALDALIAIQEKKETLTKLVSNTSKEKVNNEISLLENTLNEAISAGNKKAYDFDDTLYDNATEQLTALGKIVKDRIANGEDIKIVSARNRDQEIVSKVLGAKPNNIIFTKEADKPKELSKLGIAYTDYYDVDKDKLQKIRKAPPAAVSVPETQDSAPNDSLQKEGADEGGVREAPPILTNEQITSEIANIESMLSADSLLATKDGQGNLIPEAREQLKLDLENLKNEQIQRSKGKEPRAIQIQARRPNTIEGSVAEPVVGSGQGDRAKGSKAVQETVQSEPGDRPVQVLEEGDAEVENLRNRINEAKDFLQTYKNAPTQAKGKAGERSSIIGILPNDNTFDYTKEEVDRINEIEKRLPIKTVKGEDVNINQRNSELLAANESALKRYITELEALNQQNAQKQQEAKTQQEETEVRRKTDKVADEQKAKETGVKEVKNFTPKGLEKVEGRVFEKRGDDWFVLDKKKDGKGFKAAKKLNRKDITEQLERKVKDSPSLKETALAGKKVETNEEYDTINNQLIKELGAAINKRNKLKEGTKEYKEAQKEVEAADKKLTDFKNNNKDLILEHGTPHDFDKFDLEKIGTGEGHQAFGHGLYFTEDSKISKNYAEKLSADREGFVYKVRIKNGRTNEWLEWRDALSDSQAESISKVVKSKSIEYQEYLDNVKDGKSHTGAAESLFNEDVVLDERPLQAGAVYADLRDAFGQQEATRIMQEAGVDGVKYETRGGKGGKFNYVVFNPESILIEKKQPIKEDSKVKAEQKAKEAKSTEVKKDAKPNNRNISIAVTPFAESRIPLYKLLNKVINSFKSPKARQKALDKMYSDLEFRISNILPKGSFKINANKGVWGETENSFEVIFNGAIEDAIFLASKLGKEFDQDAVHLRDFNVKINKNYVIGQLNDDGSSVVPYIFVDFSKALTDKEFQQVLNDVGLYGGTLTNDGMSALIYNAETFTTDQTLDREKSQKEFNNKILKLKNYDSRGIRTIEGKDGYTLLWQIVRGSGEEVQGTYEWSLNEFYPKTTQELKDNLKKERDNKEWARRGLNSRVRPFVEKVSSIVPKISNSNSADYARLKAIGAMFDNMQVSDFSESVMSAYEKLSKALLLQYNDLPIRVYPNGIAKLTYDDNGKPIKQNGEYVISFDSGVQEPYGSSQEMINDVSSDNKMVFYVTSESTFGSDTSVDYSKHPLLKKSNLKATPVNVFDKDGNVVEGVTYAHPLLYNDLLRVVHDFIAHAASGASFGARGEERAWAAHVASILNDSRIKESDKLDIIKALTTETRGQNTYVNFVNENNIGLNKLLDSRREAQKAGNIDKVAEINKEIQDKYPKGIQFATQKVGLLPIESVVGGYPETLDSDTKVNKLIAKFGYGYTTPQKTAPKSKPKTDSPEKLLKDLDSVEQRLITLSKEYPKATKKRKAEIEKEVEELRNKYKFSIIGEIGAEALDKAEEATTRLDNLKVARDMEAVGKTPKEIRLATGWERGAEGNNTRTGKWRYEIGDGEIREGVNFFEEGLLLEDIFEHPELFKAYPAIKKLKVELFKDKGEEAYLDPINNILYINENKVNEDTFRNNLRSIITHESTHWIQELEGFASGGHPRPFFTALLAKIGINRNGIPKLNQGVPTSKAFTDTFERTLQSSRFRGTYEQLAKRSNLETLTGEDLESFNKDLKNLAFDMYESLAGEVEARGAQQRLGLSDGQRRQTLLEETEDVSREDQIIIIEGLNKAQFSKEKTKGLNFEEVLSGLRNLKSKLRGEINVFEDLGETQESIESQLKKFFSDTIKDINGKELTEQQANDLAKANFIMLEATAMHLAKTQNKEAAIRYLRDKISKIGIVKDLGSVSGEARFDLDMVKASDEANSITLEYNDKGEHLAPNGKPSNLTEQQAKIVRTPAFKNWFGDWENDPENSSKVVDENGEPLVVYHTSDAEFSKFDKDKIGKNYTLRHGNGFYFSSGTLGHSQWGSITKMFFINIRNIRRSSLSFREEAKENGFLNTYDNSVDIASYAKKVGVDGLFAGDSFNKELIAFSPNQIKLADGSNTTFNPNTNDVRYSAQGETLSIQDQQRLTNNHIIHLKEIGDKIKSAYLKEQDAKKKQDYLNQYNNNKRIVEFLEKARSNVKFSVDAWHGSPHSFDKFTTDKIGTGEGAQVFGWGLYFADLEGIARGYADKLKDIVNAKFETTVSLSKDEIDAINEFMSTGAHSVSQIRKRVEGLPFIGYQPKVWDSARSALRKINDSNSKVVVPSKNLYKVTLHKGKTPDQYTWLEWDKPISNSVLNQIDVSELYNLEFDETDVDGTPYTIRYKNGGFDYASSEEEAIEKAKQTILDTDSGRDLYKYLSEYLGGDKEASLFLLKNGIDGIKYPAESLSKGATSETAKGFNYVVFDENAVTIEEQIQFAREGDVFRGVTIAAGNGQSIVAAMEAPIPTTFAHEGIFHSLIEPFINDNKEYEDAFRKEYNEIYGTEENSWTTDISEYVARVYEVYLSNGRKLTEKEVKDSERRSILQKAFDTFTELMKEFYNSIITYKGKEVKLSDNARNFFDKIMLGDVGNAEGGEQATPTESPDNLKIEDLPGQITARRLAVKMKPEAIRKFAEEMSKNAMYFQTVSRDELDNLGTEAFEFLLDSIKTGTSIEEATDFIKAAPLIEAHIWLVAAAQLANHMDNYGIDGSEKIRTAITILAKSWGLTGNTLRADVLGNYIPIASVLELGEDLNKLFGIRDETGRTVTEIKEDLIEETGITPENIAKEIEEKVSDIKSPSDILSEKEFKTLVDKFKESAKKFLGVKASGASDFMTEATAFVKQLFLQNGNDYAKARSLFRKSLKDIGVDSKKINELWEEVITRPEIKTEFAEAVSKKLNEPIKERRSSEEDPLSLFRRILLARDKKPSEKTLAQRIRLGEFSEAKLLEVINKVAAYTEDPAQRAYIRASLEDRLSFVYGKTIGAKVLRDKLKTNKELVEAVMQKRQSKDVLVTTLAEDLIKEGGLSPEEALFIQRAIENAIKNKIESLEEQQANRLMLKYLGLNKNQILKLIDKNQNDLKEAVEKGDKKEQERIGRVIRLLTNRLEKLPELTEKALKNRRSISNLLNLLGSGELSTQLVARQFEEKYGLLNLTPEEYSNLQAMADALHSAESSSVRRAIYKNMSKLIKSKVKSVIDFEFFSSIIYHNLLSSPISTLNALSGNLVSSLVLGAEDLFKSFIDAVVQTFKGNPAAFSKEFKAIIDAINFGFREAQILAKDKAISILEGTDIKPDLDSNELLRESAIVDKTQAILDRKLKNAFSKLKLDSSLIDRLLDLPFLPLAIAAYSAKGVALADILKSPLELYFLRRAQLDELKSDRGWGEAFDAIEALHESLDKIEDDDSFLDRLEQYKRNELSDAVKAEARKKSESISITGDKPSGYFGMLSNLIDNLKEYLDKKYKSSESIIGKFIVGALKTFATLALPFHKMVIGRIPNIARNFTPFAFTNPLTEEDLKELKKDFRLKKILISGAVGASAGYATALLAPAVILSGAVAGTALGAATAITISKPLRKAMFNTKYNIGIDKNGEPVVVEYTDSLVKTKLAAMTLGSLVTLLPLAFFKRVDCKDKEDGDCFEPFYKDFRLLGEGPGVYPRKDGAEQHCLQIKVKEGDTEVWRTVFGWRNHPIVAALLSPITTWYDKYYFGTDVNNNKINFNLFLSAITSPLTNTLDVGWVSGITDNIITLALDLFKGAEDNSGKADYKSADKFAKALVRTTSNAVPGNSNLYRYLTNQMNEFDENNMQYKIEPLEVLEGHNTVNMFTSNFAEKVWFLKVGLSGDSNQVVYNTVGLPSPIVIDNPLIPDFAERAGEKAMGISPTYTDEQKKYLNYINNIGNVEGPFQAILTGILEQNISNTQKRNYVTVVDKLVPFNEVFKSGNDINKKVHDFVMDNLDEVTSLDRQSYLKFITKLYDIKKQEVEGELIMKYLTPHLINYQKENKEFDMFETLAGSEEIVNTYLSHPELPNNLVNPNIGMQQMDFSYKEGLKPLFTKKENPLDKELEDIWVIDSGKIRDFLVGRELLFDGKKIRKTNKYKK